MTDFKNTRRDSTFTLFHFAHFRQRGKWADQEFYDSYDEHKHENKAVQWLRVVEGIFGRIPHCVDEKRKARKAYNNNGN
jgi:hypothetical protein